MPTQMHFATFLKFLTQDIGNNIKDLSRYGGGGGKDFYGPSRRGVSELLSAECDLNLLIKKVQQASLPNAVETNASVIAEVSSWLSAQKGERFEPEKAVWKSPNGYFSLSIEPEIGLTKGAETKIIAVYPRRNGRLNREKAGAGIILLQEAFPHLGGVRFGILDSSAGKAFWSGTNSSAGVLRHHVRMVEDELGALVI
ncbi:hypothetical protein [Jiella avicenniae]|uniref:Uncharacterized protein n=1 Tax=Jiella avicenniae TaxID=2907202 RepID=A0A9X1P0G6_9HYPH|nr:hypothetical protein [Jiella avicenniae]MCE7029032.1 hypothetical protein [Jiella avicenniae]